MFAQIDLTVFDKGAGDNADNPCELIMAAPEGGEAAADGLSNGLPPAGCIPLWLAWEARLIHKDEKARFDRLVEYFLQSPDTPGVPEGSTLGYVDRDGGCAVSSIVACALATEFKGVVGGSWKPQAALPVPEGACPRTEKRYTVQSFHTGAISLRKAVADMVSTSTSEQKAEWFSFLGPLYEAKKIGAVSGSQHANVDLQSATDVIDLFTSDFRKKSEHVGELGLALIALVIGRAIRAHTAPLTGPQRFTDYGEGAPFIHIVIIGEHYYPVLPRGRLPNQAAVSMCATTVVPCKSTAVEPLSESTAVAELANVDAAGPKEVEKSPAEEAKTSNSAGGSAPISPNQAAVSMCATTVVSCKSTAVEPLSESTAVAVLANVDAAGPKEVEKSPAEEAKTSNSAGGSAPISPNQAAVSMCATTVVSCKSTAVEPLSESTAVAVLANVDAAGPKEVEKLPAEEAKTSNSAGGSPPISGAGSPSRADIKSAGMLTLSFTAPHMVFMSRRSFNRPFITFVRGVQSTLGANMPILCTNWS